MSEKLKVVWICHFSNDLIQKKLKIKKSLNEKAPWITLGIEEAKKRDDIELHVISPHRWIKRNHEFTDKNVSYHFFNPGIPLYGRHWPSFFRFDYFTNYYYNRKKIKTFVDAIKPDIINLHGAENPYYSSSIFALDSYPILITIQGLKSLSKNKASSSLFKNDLEIEQRILSKFTNFGIRVKFLEKYIRNINKDAKFFWFKYPFDSIVHNTNRNKEKTLDILFFARVTKDKGIEDLIKAIGLVKSKIPEVRLKIIGSINRSYRIYLQKLIEDNDLHNNIEITGFISNREIVYDNVINSKVVVLPTYNDILPGTIIESLKIGTPVIAYAANGVIDFNLKSKVIELVEVGNIIALADAIITMLKDSNKREKLKQAGLNWAMNEANNSLEFSKLIHAYKEIIEQFNN